MFPSESVASFLEFTQVSSSELKSLTPTKGIDAMIVFYRGIRIKAPHSPEYSSGDLLMYQWGIFDWGTGPSFELNITRQFVEEEKGDYQGLISHLSLTFYFRPESGESLGKACRLCESVPGVLEFLAFIRDSPPYVTLGDSAPDHVELDWFYI